MSGFFKKLFGAGTNDNGPGSVAEPVIYNGYEIRPEPKQEGSHWHIAGIITREGEQDGPEHRFIRADTYTSIDQAVEFSIRKARQIIDERGSSLL